MKINDLLFVYGSLRVGEASDLSINSGATLVGPDTVNGLLYSVSWFPGVKLLNNTGNFDPSLPEVHGEVYELLDEGLIRHLDAYEGYPNLFGRSQIETAHSRYVWIYTYNGSVADNQRVMTGDWINQTVEATAIAAE